MLNLTLNSYTLGMANEVTTNVDGDVLIITINRPKARNALNAAAAAGIATAVDRLDEDDSLRAAVLTGAGGTFCSGMDLKAFLTGESPDVPGRGLAGITQARPRKPLIAAVEGYALAGGLEIALACDMIVSGRSAKPTVGTAVSQWALTMTMARGRASDWAMADSAAPAAPGRSANVGAPCGTNSAG